MFNWIVWSRTVFEIKTLQCWIELFERELFWDLTVFGQRLYLYESELYELELVLHCLIVKNIFISSYSV